MDDNLAWAIVTPRDVDSAGGKIDVSALGVMF